MLEAPEFSSLVVSRPGSRALVFAKVRGLAMATALYAIGLTALVIAPLLVLEVVEPPKAGVDFPLPVHFNPPGHIQHGVRGAGSKPFPGAATKIRSRLPHPRPSESLLPPPEPESATTDDTTNDPMGPDGPSGDPRSDGDQKTGLPGGPCPGCPEGGLEGPGDLDQPYDQGTPGLAPPTLIPGSRALPKYPDLARKAGLQGTVVLLAVIEKDGRVGEIEVVKSPDQRWGFDLSAIDAVKQWRYQPALMNGAPVAAYIQVMVEFTLAR
jgi:TonB family protein